MEDSNDDFQAIQDICNVKALLKNHNELNTLIYKTFNRFIHSADQVNQALATIKNVDQLKELSKKIKLPCEVIIRLVDMLIFTYMESLQVNHKVHTAFR